MRTPPRSPKQPPTSPTPSSLLSLSRAFGRVASIQRSCLKFSMRQNIEIELEWYYFLHTINARKTIRKTDIISINLLFEPTTGIDILNRMIQAGLLIEKVDPADKRARLLSITKEGKYILELADREAELIADLLFRDIPAKQRAALERHLLAIETRVIPHLLPRP